MDGLIRPSSRGASQISSACPAGLSGVGHDRLPSAPIISTGTPGDGSIPSVGGHFRGVMDALPAPPAGGPCSLRGDANPFLLLVSHPPVLSRGHGAKVAVSPSSPCLKLCSMWRGQVRNFGRSRERKKQLGKHPSEKHLCHPEGSWVAAETGKCSRCGRNQPHQ